MIDIERLVNLYPNGYTLSLAAQPVGEPCHHEHEYEGNTFLCPYDADEPHQHSDDASR